MNIKIATWNINSIKARMLHLLDWLKRDRPDIVLLQETKCTDDTFPAMEIEELGYNIAMHGEKSYNGVAILSKFPLSDISKGLPGGGEDAQTRYIEAVVSLPRNQMSDVGNQMSKSDLDIRHPTSGIAPQALRIASVYVPNGQHAESEKFPYKLRFLDRLHAHIKTLLAYDEMLVIGGDYNIAPEDIDVHDPKLWEGSVLTHAEVRRRLRRIFNLGMYDAYRMSDAGCQMSKNTSLTSDIRHPASAYTWWDYRSTAFAMDNGLRIDHLLLSPQAADRLAGCVIEKSLRGLERASDHTPVELTLQMSDVRG